MLIVRTAGSQARDQQLRFESECPRYHDGIIRSEAGSHFNTVSRSGTSLNRACLEQIACQLNKYKRPVIHLLDSRSRDQERILADASEDPGASKHFVPEQPAWV